MHYNNYGWFITQTVEAMLPRFSGKDIVLTMKLDFSQTDHGFDPDNGDHRVRETTNFRKTVMLMFRRPMAYTEVYLNEIPQDPSDNLYRWLPIEDKEFKTKLVADHDSEWKSGAQDWIFKTMMEARDFFEELGIPMEKQLAMQMEPSLHWSIFKGSPKYWRILKWERDDPHDRDCRDFTVELHRQVFMKEISNYMVNASE